MYKRYLFNQQSLNTAVNLNKRLTPAGILYVQYITTRLYIYLLSLKSTESSRETFQ